MKTGIKLITMLSLASVLLLQAYWLFNMYRLHGDGYRQAVDQCLVEATEQELTIRKQNFDGEMHVVFKRDTNESTRYTPPQIQMKGKTLSFKYDKDDPDALHKIEQLMMHQEQPMNVVQVDSIFRQNMLARGYRVTATCVELVDLKKDSVLRCSQPGIAMRNMYASETLPVDIAGALGVKAYSSPPFMVILNRMRMQLISSAVLVIFAIVGLFLQWRTIFRQWMEEKIRRQSISAMVHEFRRPISTLGVILVNMDNALKSAPDRLEKYINGARFEIGKLIQYLGKVQDFSQKRHSEVELNLEQVPLAPFFEDLKARYVQNSGKVVIIKVAVGSGLILDTDKLYFANIMDNLVENAIKYSGNEVHIRIAAETHQDGIRVTVHDNGWGIAPKELPHIFDDFYRGKSKQKRDKDGFGLGLCYVKLMIEAMGGTVHAESKENEYTEFILNFPDPEDQNLEPETLKPITCL